MEPRAPEALLALDFGGTKAATALCDLEGNVLKQTIVETRAFSSAGRLLSSVLSDAKSMVAEAGTVLQAIGVSTMGITAEDQVFMAPNLDGWSDLKIPSRIRETFPSTPFAIENDVKAAALAETKKGELKNVYSGVYVNLGTGMSLALVYKGEVVRGFNGASGEIGYALRNRHERLGYAHDIAPAESVVGGKGIALAASEAFGREVSAKQLFEMAESGDRKAESFLDGVLSELAFQLTNVVIAWDPEVVVLGGGMVSSRDRIVPVLSKYFSEFAPYPPEIKIARFDNNPALYGAIDLAKQLLG